MELFYFFLSLICSLGVILFFRFKDRNNRSFEKIFQLSNKVRSEIENGSSENLQQLRMYNETILETSKRAEQILSELKEYSQHQNKNPTDEKMMNRINTLEQQLDETRSTINEQHSSPMTVSRNIKSLLKESMKEMKSMRSELKEMQDDLKLSEKNTTSTLNNHSRDIGLKISNYRKELEMFVNEHWKKFSDEAEFLKSDLQKLSEKMESLRVEQLSCYKSDLEGCDKEEREKLQNLRDDVIKLREEAENDVTKKIQDYAAYFDRLETRAQNFSQEIDLELKKNVDEKLTDIAGLYERKTAELSDYVNELQTSARSVLQKEVREHEQRNETLTEEFNKRNNEAAVEMTEFRTFIEESLKNLETLRNDSFAKIKEAEKDLDAHINIASEQALKLESKVFDNVNNQLRDFRNATDTSIKEVQQDLRSRMEENRLSVEKMGEDISLKNIKYSGILESLQKEVDTMKSESNDFTAKCNSSMEELKVKMAGFGARIDSEISRMDQNALDKLSETKEHLVAERESLEENLKNELEQLTSKMEIQRDELFKNVSKDFSDLEMRLNEKRQDLDSKISDISSLMTSNTDGIRSDIEYKYSQMEGEVKERLEEIENSFEMKRSILEKQVEDFEHTLNNSLEEFERRIDGTDSHLLEVENEYFAKGEKYMAEVKTHAEDLERRAVQLHENLELLKGTVDSDVNAHIENGKKEIAEAMENGHKDIERVYREYEAECNEKISKYKENLSTMEQNVKRVEERFDLQLENKLSSVDNDLSRKLDLLSETYRSRVNRMTDEVADLQSKTQQNLENLQTDTDSKANKLLEETQSRMAELETGYKQLKDQLSNLGATLGSELEAQLLDGRTQMNNHLCQMETDSIKRINEYKSELLSVRKDLDDFNNQFKQKINESGALINDQLKEKYAEIEADNETQMDRIRENLESVEKGLRTMVTGSVSELKDRVETMYSQLQTDYSGKFDTVINDNTDRLDRFSENFGILQSQITTLSERIDADINQKVNNGLAVMQSEFDEKMNESREILRVYEEDSKKLFENYKNDFENIKESMKQIDERYTTSFEDETANLNKKIAQIELAVKKFEKQTQTFDKTIMAKERLENDLKQIADQMREVKAHKNEIDDIEKKIINIAYVAGTTDDKYNDILNSSKKIEVLSQSIQEMRDFVDQVQVRIDHLSDVKTEIGNIESAVDMLSGRYNNIETQISRLDDKEGDLQRVKNTFGKVDTTVRDIENRILNITKNIENLQLKENVFEKSMAEFERNAAPIVNSYDVIKEVVERFKTMDALLYDLDSRKEALSSAREKAVKAQTLFENLNRECDEKIKVMEGMLANGSAAVGRQSGEKRKVSSDNSDNTRGAVLGLFRQGTTTDQIANMLKLSTAEVEFYIDSQKDGK